MDLRTRIQLEVVTRRLAVGQAIKRLRVEEREAQRERRQVPRPLMDRLLREIADAKLHVGSAVASFEAVNKYPPLKVTA